MCINEELCLKKLVCSPDTRNVRLELGLGVWLELPIEQAREHVRLKKEMYTRQAGLSFLEWQFELLMKCRWAHDMEPSIQRQQDDWNFVSLLFLGNLPVS